MYLGPTKKIVIENFLVWPRDHGLKTLEKLEKLAELDPLTAGDHNVAHMKEHRKFFL